MKLELKQKGTGFGMELRNERGFSCQLDAGEDLGGNNQGFRPMELLAGSLAGCLSIDLIHILKKQRIELENLEVEILGERKNEIPSPFKEIILTFLVKREEDVIKAEKALALSKEKYCSVSVSLSKEIAVKCIVKKA